ncbi:MAG: hypothetical protein CMN30_25935 [Sandaracinus sp.]|nr:hypothetical protein [Sandaracinus sp.]
MSERRRFGMRARLAALLLAILLPSALVLVLAQRHWELRTAALATAEATAERFSDQRLARCEESPETFGAARGRRRLRHRPGRSRGMHVYDAELRPANEASPLLDQAMAEELRSDGVAWRRVAPATGPAELQVALVVAESGPCSVVLVSRPIPSLQAPLWPALVFALLAIGAASVAAGPLVRRIRRLTRAVTEARERGAAFEPDPARDEIGELARAFAADRARLAAHAEELERRERMLTEFVSNTTHDVGIPLTVLQGHLVALRQRLDDGADRAVLGHALEEAHYIGALIRNLGAAAKLDDPARSLVAEPVDLGALVERVASRHGPLARAKGVAFDHATPDEPLRVRGDLTLLEQAVGNLAHNAVRYNEPGGHVALVLEAEGDTFRIQVVDDGPGVGPEDLPRLGERRFRSEEARSRQPTGTGLGLSIARDVAARHGMTLSFAAAEPHGLVAILEGALLSAADEARAEQ